MPRPAPSGGCGCARRRGAPGGAPRRAARNEPVVVRAPKASEAIVERPVVPMLRLRKLQCPDDFGRLQMLDALTLDFDYGGVIADGDDERQFVRADPASAAGPSFVRRNPAAEAAAFETMRRTASCRCGSPIPRSAKGRRVFVFRGRDACEHWHRFVTERVPALQSLGWRSQIEGDFGPPVASTAGLFDAPWPTRGRAASRSISASRSTACGSRCCRS